MRLVMLVLAVVGLGACPVRNDATIDEPGDDGAGSGPPPECVTDDQCVLAGASCCACPSYAIGTSDPSVAACNGVACPMPDCTDNVRPSCEQGRCELACKPLACEQTCDSGYALDANGCLTCACAPADNCAVDTDCHAVGADCCGCQRGGTETAVVDPAAYTASLGCPADPLCPGDNTCDPEAITRCVAHRCFLLGRNDQTPPDNRCGRPDLHPDPAHPNATACPGPGSDGTGGEVCVVNAVSAANAQGIGVCLSP